MKNKMGLVGKVLLGSALTFGGLSAIPETAYSQQVIVVQGSDQAAQDAAMANLAVSHMAQFTADHVPHNQGAILRGLAGLNRDLAWSSLYHAQNRNTIIVINQNNNQNATQLNQLPQEYRESRTFISRKYVPSNPGVTEWKDFDKLNDTIYAADEPLTIGVYLAMFNKKDNVKIKLYDPQKNLIGEANMQGSRDTPEFVIPTVNRNMDDVHKKGGNGTYIVTFDYGGKFWEARSFKFFK